MIIHDFHKVSCTYLAHAALFIIQFTYLPVEPASTFHNCLEVHNIVKVTLHSRYLAYQRLDLFISEDSAYTSPSGLLHPYLLPLWIIEGEVKHPYQGMFSCRPGGYYPDILFLIVIIGKYPGKLFSQHMTVRSFCRGFKYLHFMVYAINEHYHILLSLTLHLKRIKSCELQERAEESSHITVHY